MYSYKEKKNNFFQKKSFFPQKSLFFSPKKSFFPKKSRVSKGGFFQKPARVFPGFSVSGTNTSWVFKQFSLCFSESKLNACHDMCRKRYIKQNKVSDCKDNCKIGKKDSYLKKNGYTWKKEERGRY